MLLSLAADETIKTIETIKKVNTYGVIRAYAMSFFKVLLVGDPGVGKSSLLAHLRNEPFAVPYNKSKQLEVHPIKYKDTLISFWTINAPLSERYYEDADAVIIMYDLTQKHSKNGVDIWYEETYITGPMIMVGNKSDLPHKSILPYFDISVKTGENVNTFMDHLLTKLVASN